MNGINIIVTSLNPVKLAATKEAFSKLLTDIPFNVTGTTIKTPKGLRPLSEQPIGVECTQRCAVTRINYLVKQLYGKLDCNYIVSFEGGITFRLTSRNLTFTTKPHGNGIAITHDYELENIAHSFACCAVYRVHDSMLNCAYSGMYPLPMEFHNRLDDGEELGPINDDLTSRSNTKQADGVIGLMTDNNVTRKDELRNLLLITLAFEFASKFNWSVSNV